MNPKDEFGNYQTCHVCGSVNHFARQWVSIPRGDCTKTPAGAHDGQHGQGVLKQQKENDNDVVTALLHVGTGISDMYASA